MEKKRRARINVSLEQLKSLLEKHYSHQVRPGEEEENDRSLPLPFHLHLPGLEPFLLIGRSGNASWKRPTFWS